MAERIYLVRLSNGLVVSHTEEEFKRLMAGVDREASRLHNAPLFEKDDPDE